MAARKRTTRRRVKKAGKTVKVKRTTRRRGRKGKKATRGRKKKAVKKKLGKRKRTRTARKVKKTLAEGEEGVTDFVTPKPSEKQRPSIIPTTFKTPTGPKHIKDFLNEKKVKFEAIKHSPAFTAQQIAASAHVSGKNLAKTVIVKIDGKMAMVIEPAHMKADLDAIKRQLNASRVELASEAEFRSHFPDCELGAMPPFGNLYDMEVLVSDNLSRDEFITFNAGTHAELIKMAYKDFYTLVRPKVVYA